MKQKTKPAKAPAPPSDSKDRAAVTAKAMSESLIAEHKRWNMPLLGWKDGKITETQP